MPKYPWSDLGDRAETVAAARLSSEMGSFLAHPGLPQSAALMACLAELLAASVGTLPAVVASIEITPGSQSIVEGQGQQFTATALDANGAAIPGVVFTWSVSDPTTASTDQTGLVTAVAPGSTTLQASARGITGTAPITVTPDTVVTNVTVSPPSGVVIIAGTTLQLTATATNAEGRVLSGLTFTWSSSNTADATVSPSGLVAGVAAGNVGITVTESVSGLSALCAITVQATATGLTLTADKTSFVVTVGETISPVVRTRSVSLDLAPNPPALSWSSSNTGVATVNASTGVVTGVAAGAVVITATSSAGSIAIPGVVLSNTFVLRDRWVKANSTTSAGTAETGQAWTAVSPSVAGILTDALYFPTPATDAPVIANAGVSDGLFFFRLHSPAGGAAFYLRWTDGNNYLKVYTQAAQLVVKGKSAGANLSSYFWNCAVNPDDVLIVRASGNKLQFQVNGDIIGSINDTGYGALTGTNVGMGFQSISATTAGPAFGRFGEVAVRALDHAPSTTESAIALSCASATITSDGIFAPPVMQLLATGENMARGRNTSNSAPLASPVSWSSSNASVATVSSQGVIRGVAPGSCTITASDGATATLSLTVGLAAGFSASLAYTHEPSGFTQRTDRDFSVFNPAGTPDTWAASLEQAGTNMTLQGDQSAPKSPGNPGVLQLEYPGGLAEASNKTYTAGTLELDFSANTDVAGYICRWTKLTADPAAFQGHPSGANKMGEFFLNQGATGFAHALQGAFCHNTTEPVNPRLALNGGTDYRAATYLPTNLVLDAQQIRGNWHKIEWAFQVNTIAADGTPNYDGHFHLWLDDRKVLEYRNVKFTDVTGAHVTQWKPSWIWGGLGGTIASPNGFFVLEDHEHVSSGASLGAI